MDNRIIKILIVPMIVFLSEFNVMAQEGTKPFLDEFSGNANLTHNGISLIPSFSLGEPALAIEMKFAKNDLSLEPDLRFALEGKPWFFVFWLRYQAIRKERFSLRVGAHPALNFRTVSIIRDGRPEELMESRRFVAAEVVPSYKLSDKVSIGMYYLRGRGFDEGLKNSDFVTLNASFTNLALSEKLYLNITPQVYYLRLDNETGYYVAGFITLAKKDFPLSISSILNKAIDTQIVPEEDFIWNLSLNYSFGVANRRMSKRKI